MGDGNGLRGRPVLRIVVPIAVGRAFLAVWQSDARYLAASKFVLPSLSAIVDGSGEI